MHDGHFFDEIEMRKSKTTLMEIGELINRPKNSYKKTPTFTMVL